MESSVHTTPMENTMYMELWWSSWSTSRSSRRIIRVGMLWWRKEKCLRVAGVRGAGGVGVKGPGLE
jgi:hypothetical protein